MKILTISGSPRPKNSCSEYLLNGLCQSIDAAHSIETCSLKEATDKNAWEMYQAIIIAFPLYVDGVPSHLLAWMKRLEHHFSTLKTKPLLYIIVNCGFFEPKQNHLAISIVENWCRACCLPFAGALACGGGGMICSAPIGHGPNKNLGIALQNMGNMIQNQQCMNIVFVKPNFPRFLYIQMAHMGWRQQGRQNGLQPANLYAQASKIPE